jgi:hypothetical protein
MAQSKAEYLRRAEEAEAKAMETGDPDARAAFKEAARQWRILAEQAK